MISNYKLCTDSHSCKVIKRLEKLRTKNLWDTQWCDHATSLEKIIIKRNVIKNEFHKSIKKLSPITQRRHREGNYLELRYLYYSQIKYRYNIKQNKIHIINSHLTVKNFKSSFFKLKYHKIPLVRFQSKPWV